MNKVYYSVDILNFVCNFICTTLRPLKVCYNLFFKYNTKIILVALVFALVTVAIARPNKPNRPNLFNRPHVDALVPKGNFILCKLFKVHVSYIVQ